VQQVGAGDDSKEHQQEKAGDGRPNPQAPSNQKEQAQPQFSKGENMGDKLHAGGRKHFEGLDLETEVRQI
jgi:hypothetical protein